MNVDELYYHYRRDLQRLNIYVKSLMIQYCTIELTYSLSSPFSDLQQSCSPSLSSLLHSLLFGLFQMGNHRPPSPLGSHMVLNQSAVSTSEGGSSLRCVMVPL